MAEYTDFTKLDMRVGEIREVLDFPEARKPAYRLRIFFGSDVGVLTSSAQLTKTYSKKELVGKLIIGLINLPPRQIGPVRSEVLTLGVPNDAGECILISPSVDVPVGGKVY